MSIKTKILLRMVLTVLISLSVLGIFSILLNIESTDDSLEQMLTEMSTVAAGRVQQELQAHTNVAMETGCDARLSSDISVRRVRRPARNSADSPRCSRNWCLITN